MCAEQLVVNTAQGALRGTWRDAVQGGTYRCFLGIPYAQAPVGELRFQAPREPTSWTGVRDATQEGNPAPAYAMITGEYLTESSEDCLFLNVYTPQDVSREKKPVMVYIHGGGFASGSGSANVYGPDYLVAEDVIVITFNYRLGLLGFLNLQSPLCSGNNGLKDMVMLLKWVQANISQFGGDPGNVTIFGESAGGAAVQYLLLSRMARGLFHKAISQSGSVLNSWAFTPNPRERAFKLGEILGCKTTDDKELLEFFKTVAPRDFVENSKAVTKITNPEEHYVHLPFTPSIELDHQDAFLSKDPEELLKSGEVTDVPYVIGGNTMEGLVLAKGGPHVFDLDPEHYAVVVPPSLRALAGGDLKNVVEKMKQKYFSNGFDKIAFIQAMSARMFWSGIDKTVEYHMKNMTRKSPTYLYHFTFDGKCAIYKNNIGCGDWKGTCHADDLGYVFHSTQFSPKLDADSDELKVITHFAQLWTNFTKHGNPTPGDKLGVTWQPVSADRMWCLQIDSEITMKEDPEGEDIAFWKQLYQQYQK